MAKKRFVRRNTTKYLRLGSKRRKMQKWRRSKGRDAKTRLEMAGYGAVVKVGYKRSESERGKVNGKEVKMINNIKDLENMKQNEIAFLCRMGNKKKELIAKKAIEKNIEIINFNSKNFIKEIEHKNKKKTSEVKK